MSSPPEISDIPKKTTMSSMSMKKYNEIKKVIEDECHPKIADRICQQICNIMKFDPSVGISSRSRTENTTQWRKQKMLEYGVNAATILKGIKKLNKPESTPK